MKTPLTCFLIFGLILCLSVPAWAVVQYTVTDLGTFGGTTGANGVNNSGQVAGYSAVAFSPPNLPVYHAFLYSNGTMTDLEIASYAWGINDAGQVVGSANGGAFVYNNGQVTLLGGESSNASAINNKGQIVGWSYNDTAVNTHAVIFHDGTLTDLGTLDGIDSYARDINSSGEIVGASSMSGILHPFLYKDNKMVDLGTLGGSSQAFAINDAGDIVGYSDTNNGTHGFLYRGGIMSDLGTLGGSLSNANDINNGGQIVGVSYTVTADSHAFIIANRVMNDLNDLIAGDSGWVLSSAESINDLGQIVGNGIHNGNNRAFLLTPVPEPSTLALFCMSFISIIAFTWRQRRAM